MLTVEKNLQLASFLYAYVLKKVTKIWSNLNENERIIVLND